ncbi:MAG: peptidylprolyl isomerase [Phycisphaerae bacterium]|nr:peptidylprolyl isomerase [Saprospiraceae bacterium]
MKKLLVFNLFLLFAFAANAQAKFTVPAQKFVAPAEITFTNATPASKKPVTYAWDFGDAASVGASGNTSTDANPTHRYAHSGNYTVTLTAKKGKKITTFKQMVQVTAPERCLVEIETDFGTMTAELYNATPKHRDNFIKLAEEGYYNDLLFHRVINGFMIQGGDPDSRNAPAGTALGMGGPSYQVPAEFVDSICHLKGALAAARRGGPGNPEKKSSGSQFYIVQGSPVNEQTLNQIETMHRFHYTPEQRAAYLAEGGTPQLDQDYTVFGRVIKGLDVIDKIAAVEKAPGDRPLKDVKMKIKVIK